jgi:hypothetical protein
MVCDWAFWSTVCSVAGCFCLLLTLLLLLLLLLLLHPRLFRREAAIMACEWSLAVLPISTGLGLMRHNKSAVEVIANPALLVTLAMWMSFCFKAACRQVRTV